jgi:hypothetical protein
MRSDKSIDYDAPSIGDKETLIRLLCSPLYYDEATGQVSIDAFDLRMLGRKQNQPEHYASLGREKFFANKEERQHYLQVGYTVWDDKEWDSNRYYGYGTFLACEAKAISSRIELWPLKGSAPYHIGLFYTASEDAYYKGPLPKDDTEILFMLSELAEMIEDNIEKAPERELLTTDGESL